MSRNDLYTRTGVGANPVLLADVKSYLKQTSTSDDVLIQTLIDSAVEYGEAYTGRDFRANTWTLLIDAFTDRIVLRRNPVDAISSVKYLLSTVLTTIATSVYYLKKGVQCAEILLQDGETWPSDLDNIEHGIQIVFTTVAYRNLDQIKDALYRHINHLYHNRGDCDTKSAAELSGADTIYNQFRIARV